MLFVCELLELTEIVADYLINAITERVDIWVEPKDDTSKHQSNGSSKDASGRISTSRTNRQRYILRQYSGKIEEGDHRSVEICSLDGRSAFYNPL